MKKSVFFKEIKLKTKNLDLVESFYGKILEFNYQRKTDLINFVIGDTSLVFKKDSNYEHIPFHIAFRVSPNSIFEVLDWVANKSIKTINNNEEKIINFNDWNAKSIYFKDLEGNVLEIISYNSSEISKGIDFISVNEIGLVSDNPLNLANEIINITGINFYERGFFSDSFVALGSDSGLFVINSCTRKWFPTDVLSRPVDIEVKVVIEGILYFLKFDSLGVGNKCTLMH